MKRSSYLFLTQFMSVLFCVFSVFSCHRNEDRFPHEAPEILLDNSGELLLECTAGTAEFTYTIENKMPGVPMEVVKANSEAWITDIDASEIGKVTFRYAANESETLRMEILNMVYADARTSIQIKQKGQALPEISVETSELALGAGEGTAEIRYTVDKPVEGAVLEVEKVGQADWITEINAEKEGAVVFRYAANDEAEERTVELKLVYAGAEASVMVRQEAKAEAGADVTRRELAGTKFVTRDDWNL